MPVTCREITNKIEERYPLNLAEDYDNVGLLIGSYQKKIGRILVCLEIDNRVVDEAIKKNIDMIITHHPIIFKPIKRIIDDSYITSVIIKLIRSGINVYALHTNFDNADGGMNDILAERIGLQNIHYLSDNKKEALYKVAVYVPVSHEEAVRNALFNAGAGHIGNYSSCSFNIYGKGTFIPLEGTSPYIGKRGKLEKVDEVKIETIVKKEDLERVIDSMLKAHPYEEAAYDIYELNNSIIYGTGRYGTLKEEMSFKDFCSYLKQKLNIPYVNAAGDMERIVQKVSIVGGAGTEFIKDSIKKGCDVFVTGDIKHHEAIDALNSGINIVDGSHYFTEVVALPYIAEFISSSFNIECNVTEVNTNPFTKV